MIKRWLLYLVTALGCIIFFAAHQTRMAWLLMMLVLLTPWLSLVLSLAPMVLAKPSLSCPDIVTVGSDVLLRLELRSPLPLPPYRASLRLENRITGHTLRAPGSMKLSTEHCGGYRLECEYFHIYDLLGMFRLSRRIPPQRILVRPMALDAPEPRELERLLSRSLQPKPGGGFAEQHELRLFRPGDSMNQIHWKLTAKTGKLTIREPMVPRHGRIVLTVSLFGDPHTLDRKFGRLLTLSRQLTERGLEHDLLGRTADGTLCRTIRCSEDLTDAVDELLCSSAAGDDTVPDLTAAWHCHIGGNADEG